MVGSSSTIDRPVISKQGQPLSTAFEPVIPSIVKVFS
jgi:hypothetical protein